MFRVLTAMVLILMAGGPPLAAFSWFGGGPTEVQFSGRVVDSATGSPLVGATVLVAELHTGDMTDIDGAFSLRLRAGTWTVTVRYMGYREVSERITCTGLLRRRFALAPSSIELPEVRIESGYHDAHMVTSPQSMIVLGHADLDRLRGQTLGETLKDLPGLTVLQTGPGISKPVVRGLHSQRVTVMNGGLAQEGQQWGGEHAPEIDPFAVDRVEVIKGAAAVQYGAGAIGGVIRVEPPPLRTLPGWGGALILNGFSNNRQGAGSLLLEAAPAALPGWAARVQASVREAGTATTPEYRIDNSGFRERTLSGALGTATDAAGLELRASRFSTELGIPRSTHFGSASDLYDAITRGRPLQDAEFTYDIAAPRQEITHDQLALHGHWIFSRLGRLTLTLGRQVNHRQEWDAHRRGADSSSRSARPAFDLELVSHAADVTFAHQPLGAVFGTVGVGFSEQTNVGNSLSYLIPNYRMLGFGSWIMETWSRDPLTINAGLRVDSRRMRVYAYAPRAVPDTTHSWLDLSGSVGLIWKLSTPLTLAANLGTAWRAPGINELYSNGVHHGTAQYEIGDRGLDRERSLSADLSLRVDHDDLYIDIGTFGTWFENYISLLPELPPTLTLRGIFPTFRYRQSRALLAGLDGTLRWAPFATLSTGFTGSLVRGTDLDRNEPLFLMPADRFRLFVHLHGEDWGAITEPYAEVGLLFVRRQDRVPSAQDYAPPPDGYHLVDLELGGTVTAFGTPLHLQLAVRNLFNTRYRDYLSRFRYFMDDPGTDLSLRLHVPIGDRP